MKHVPRVPKEQLTPALQRWVEHRRDMRRFDARAYLSAKRKLLATYFEQQGIKVALVAVSGGIDSAVVLGLLAGIPSITTIAVTLPARDEPGATRQDETEELARQLGEAFNVHIYTFNIHDAIATIQDGITASTELKSTNWSRGQSVAYTRTASLYSLTAALADRYRTVLVGTTNKDEGSYLGYIGKASDGMVDIQPISDLHKSQVYEVAAVLNVPTSVRNAVPTGDMFDGRTDEEVFGAPYDFVELYTSLKNEYPLAPNLELMNLEDGLDEAFGEGDYAQFRRYAEACEQLHLYNRHKYIGSSPAVHFDLVPFELKDGWLTNCRLPAEKPKEITVPYTTYIASRIDAWRPAFPAGQDRLPGGRVDAFRNVIPQMILDELMGAINRAAGKWEPADKYGKINRSGTHWLTAVQTGDLKTLDEINAASWRLNVLSEDLANIVLKRITHFLPELYHNDSQTDLTAGFDCWTKSRINPFFRAIKYTSNGSLMPHYDDAYRGYPGEVSLKSVLIFLTPGTTRFIRESRALHEYRDQDRPPEESRILSVYNMQPGDALVFDHRMLHDSGPIDGEKIVLRSDFLYKHPQLGRALR